MALSLNEIRARAAAFARDWQDAASERADAQGFWTGFFGVFGIRARRVGAFERPVAGLATFSGRGRIDFLWKGVVLVEHKSRGEDLDRAAGQARDYFPGLKDAELPRFILVSDFARIRLHDLDTGAEAEFALAELPRRLDLFGFLTGYVVRPITPLDPVNAEAAARLGDLHEILERDGYGGRALDVWMVRTLFCLFADRAGIFETGLFRALIETRAAPDGSDLGAWITRLHAVLATPPARRQAALDETLAAFPYVDGALFDAPVEPPETNARMRAALLACCTLDWSRVSPAIFGSLFQSIKNRAARRGGGEHYTSEENILKCLDPLLLDELRTALEAARREPRRLRALLARLRRVLVFDPACGCGNFLVVAYRELRLLELAALRLLYGAEDAGELAGVVLSQVDVDQMAGIEAEDWPAQIAQVALWLTDHQMNMAVSEAFGTVRLRLPLAAAPRIVTGNALRLDWSAIMPAGPDVYCVGNPPFVGAKFLAAEQRQDVALVFGGARNAGLLDYVACWYRRAADWLATGPEAAACFVATSSLTQGEQPAALWAGLLARGVVIRFAHRPFKWRNEAPGLAAVYCVIIGFGLRPAAEKRLFVYETPTSPPHETRAAHINPCLVDAPDLLLTRRTRPLAEVPELGIGNKPIDGGQYLFTEAERAAFVSREPAAAQLFRPWMGADELLYGYRRFCLWLGDTPPAALRALPEVRKRVEAVRALRAASRSLPTRALAERPTRFHVENMPKRRYLVIPRVSSEHRRYIPMSFVPPRYLTGDTALILPQATPYHFGVLSSAMHMAWVRAVAGRLEGRLRYSAQIVYNNFPWPDAATTTIARVTAAAEAVLAARDAFQGATLAELYDPLFMPDPLARAHRTLDRAVDAAYGLRRAPPDDAARLAFLFARTEALTAPLDAAPRDRASRRRAVPLALPLFRIGEAL